MKSLTRYISKFNMNDEKHICDIHFITTPELDWLQKTFNIPSDNPMYDEYEISAAIAKSIRQFIAEDLNTDEYFYFLSAYRT